ncbi:hypothetical protein Tco_0676224 [Tanacetum coccineum]
MILPGYTSDYVSILVLFWSVCICLGICCLLCLLESAVVLSAVCLVCSRSFSCFCNFVLMSESAAALSAAVYLICSHSSLYLCDSVESVFVCNPSFIFIRTSLLNLYLSALRLPLLRSLCCCLSAFFRLISMFSCQTLNVAL